MQVWSYCQLEKLAFLLKSVATYVMKRRSSVCFSFLCLIYIGTLYLFTGLISGKSLSALKKCSQIVEINSGLESEDLF